MAYRYGRGFGFRGSSPAWPYVGLGRGGLPRCWYTGFRGIPAYGPASFIQEAEKEFLKNEADAIKAELNRVEARIRDLEASK